MRESPASPRLLVENHRVVGLDPADPIRFNPREKIGDEPTGLERPGETKLKADRQHSGTIVDGISRIGYLSGGTTLDDLLAQNNHPNRAGHEIVARELLAWFPLPPTPLPTTKPTS
jgi:hypothetical protein